MMKGSTNTQATMPQNTGPQNMGGQSSNRMLSMLGMMFPGYGQRFGAGTGTGSKGAVQPQAPQMSIPAMPQYTNYQQMPVYSSQPAAPSDAITRFMSGYASGGNVRPAESDSIEDDIKAALRLARLIGELTKKE
jgi:hypothetical protein